MRPRLFLEWFDSYLHDSWLGHHQKNLWTESSHRTNCIAQIAKRFKWLGQHACMLLRVNYSFQSHTFKFCTKLRVCVNIRVTEMSYWSSAGKHWHRWAFNQVKHLWGKKKKNTYRHEKHTSIHPTSHPSSIHRNKSYKNPATAEIPLCEYGANVHSDRTGQ